ncbi:MAG: hypothetical protein HY344_00995 [Candidatus Levybacteria bacterium]|nr:hypothetical protein [Candidatus Levybacteria bacterium]
MNPKNVNDLDPKLREAYERVMGSNFTPKSADPQPQPAPNAPQPAGEPPKENPTPQPNTPLMQTSQVPSQNLQAPDPALNKAAPIGQSFATTTVEPPSGLFAQSPSTSVTNTQKKKLNMLPLLFIIGGLIFFGAYIVIWAKVFGLF